MYRSLNDIYSQLKEIPDLEEQGSHGDVLASLKMLHDICVDLEKQIGECPVFATEMGCPFKTVCGDGRLMVAKMEENLPSNFIGEVVREEKNTMERELLASSGTAFYQELKERTKEKHRVTNSRPFIKHLIKGKVNIAVYKLLLSNLYFLYR